MDMMTMVQRLTAVYGISGRGGYSGGGDPQNGGALCR